MKAHSEAATLLDLISIAMDSPHRPLDGVVVFDLNTTDISLGELEKGARSARFRYPVSASIIQDKAWVFRPDLAASIGEHKVKTEAEGKKCITDFLATRSDLYRQPSLRQILVRSPETLKLVTFADHAVADLMSVLNWTRHQFDVVAQRRPSVTTIQTGDRPALKTHEKPSRKNSYAYRGSSSALWSRSKRNSSYRNFCRLSLKADVFRRAVEDHKDITYNDLLIAVILDVYYRWNLTHEASTTRIALWCPVNIRTAPFMGFGNGSSRIRIYPRLSHDSPLLKRCQEVRTQIRAAKKEGEWFIPQSSALLKLPTAIMNLVAKAYFNRPWVDMATAPFSHIERLGPDDTTIPFPEVTRIEALGELHRRHPLGLCAITMNNETTLTFVYDPQMLAEQDAAEFMTLLEECFAKALVAL
jgi:NRPS condensation-like uncharacterized protein